MTTAQLTRLTVTGLLLGGCSFHSAPTVAPEAIPSVEPPIHRSLVLLVTDDFARFVLQGSQDNREFHYELGPGAVAALDDLLGRSFSSFRERRVSSEAAALLQLTRPGADTLGPDLIALAKFPAGAGTYVRPFAAGVEVRVQLDIVSRDGRLTETIVGVGRGSAGVYFGSAVAGAGNRALTAAIATLADSLRAHRQQLEQ